MVVGYHHFRKPPYAYHRTCIQLLQHDSDDITIPASTSPSINLTCQYTEVAATTRYVLLESTEVMSLAIMLSSNLSQACQGSKWRSMKSP